MMTSIYVPSRGVYVPKIQLIFWTRTDIFHNNFAIQHNTIQLAILFFWTTLHKFVIIYKFDWNHVEIKYRNGDKMKRNQFCELDPLGDSG